jgi:hypothetical protein
LQDAENLCAENISHLFLQLKPVQGHPRWVSIEQRPSPVTINIGSFSEKAGFGNGGDNSTPWKRQKYDKGDRRGKGKQGKGKGKGRNGN